MAQHLFYFREKFPLWFFHPACCWALSQRAVFITEKASIHCLAGPFLQDFPNAQEIDHHCHKRPQYIRQGFRI